MSRHLKKSPPEDDEQPRSSQDMLVPRLLATLISLTVVGLGTMTVLTEHYYGQTSKLGGAEAVLDGGPAVLMGWATIFFGLLPLGLWFPGKRSALVWSVACVMVAVILLGIAIYGHRPLG